MREYPRASRATALVGERLVPVHDGPSLEIFGAAVVVAVCGIRVTDTYRQRRFSQASSMPDRRRSERRGTLEGVPSIKF